MASTPFKMRGNPMKRNFGIGESPAKKNGRGPDAQSEIVKIKAEDLPEAEKMKKTKTRSDKKVKRKEKRLKRLRRKAELHQDLRREGGSEPTKRQKRHGRKYIKKSNRADRLERKIYEKSGQKAKDEAANKRRIESQMKIDKASKFLREKGFVPSPKGGWVRPFGYEK